MILVYVDNIDSAIQIGGALGNIVLINQTIKRINLKDQEIIKDIKAQAKAKRFIHVKIQGLANFSDNDVYLVWNNKMLFAPFEYKEYKEYIVKNHIHSFTEFLSVSVQYKKLDPEKSDFFLSIFKNSQYNSLICAASGINSIKSFYQLYYLAYRDIRNSNSKSAILSRPYKIKLSDYTPGTIINTFKKFDSKNDIAYEILKDNAKNELALKTGFALQRFVRKKFNINTAIDLDTYLMLKFIAENQDSKSLLRTADCNVRFKVTNSICTGTLIDKDGRICDIISFRKVLQNIPITGTIKTVSKSSDVATSDFISREAIIHAVNQTLKMDLITVNKCIMYLFVHGFITNPNLRGNKIHKDQLESLYRFIVSLHLSEDVSKLGESVVEDMLMLDESYVPQAYLTNNIDDIGTYITDVPFNWNLPKEICEVYKVIFSQTLKCLLRESASNTYDIKAAFGQYTLTADNINCPELAELKDGDNIYCTFSLNQLPSSALTCSDSDKTIESFYHYYETTFEEAITHNKCYELYQLLLRERLIDDTQGNVSPAQLGYTITHYISSYNLQIDLLNQVKSADDFESYKEKLIKELVRIYESMVKGMNVKTTIPCPSCTHMLNKTDSNYYCPNCRFNIMSNPFEVKLSESEMEYLIKHRSTPFLKDPSPDAAYAIKLVLNAEGKLKAETDSNYICPKCNSKLKLNNKMDKYICPSCRFTLNICNYGYTFKAKDIRAILSEKHKTDIVEISIEQEKHFAYFMLEDGVLKLYVLK